MNIKSLGYRTDFIFNEFDGSIVVKNDYIVATTNSNPNYFWGNLLLYSDPPERKSLKKWKEDFKREFSNPDIYHITLAWDSPNGEEGDPSAFIEDGFKLEKSIVLTSSKVKEPPKFNPSVSLKIIESDQDYEKCVQTQISCGSPHLSKQAWEGFYRKQMKQYRKMISEKRGLWFGAVLDDQLVGNLGIFSDREVGRFQIVSTHPDFQRKGVCSTLVNKSANYAFDNLGLETLVMVADETYHAAKIYESVGFEPTEKQIGLCWYDESKS